MCAWAATPTLCGGCAHKGPEPGTADSQNLSLDCWQLGGVPTRAALSSPGLHAPTTCHCHAHKQFGHACMGCLCLQDWSHGRLSLGLHCPMHNTCAVMRTATSTATAARSKGAPLALPGRRPDLPRPLPLTQRVLAPGGGGHGRGALWGHGRGACASNRRQPKAGNTNDPKPPQVTVKHPRGLLRPAGPPSTHFHKERYPLCALRAELGRGTLNAPAPPPRLGPAACVDSGVLSGPTGR